MIKKNDTKQIRNFGYLFSFVFLLIGLYPIINNDEIRMWSIVISILFFFSGLFRLKYLIPLLKIWMKFGILLGNLISPIVLGIIFFGLVTPTSFLMKIFKKDHLKLKKELKQKTYWIKKDDKQHQSMKNQF